MPIQNNMTYICHPKTALFKRFLREAFLYERATHTHTHTYTDIVRLISSGETPSQEDLCSVQLLQLLPKAKG
jgi:hypothetical protein